MGRWSRSHEIVVKKKQKLNNLYNNKQLIL